MTSAAATALTNLAAAESSHGGHHPSLSPYLTGFGALGILVILLLITTRFNRD